MPRERPRQDLRTYNLRRRLGSLERQQKQDFRQTMTDLQALETSIQSGNKTAMEAQLLEFELKYPEYAAATTAITEMLKAEKQNPFVKHEPINVGRVMGLLNQIRVQLSGQGAAQPSIIIPDPVKSLISTAADTQG